MEFLAATKEGIIIYDAAVIEKDEGDSGDWRDWTKGQCLDGIRCKVVARLPSPENAVGHVWSKDGTCLASVCEEGLRIYDAPTGYKELLCLEKVAPDVNGRSGGVRSVTFSPQNNYLCSYEKWDPLYPENVHVWCIKGDKAGERLRSMTLKGYTSGAVPVQMVAWTHDEGMCLELQPGKGIMVREGSMLGADIDESCKFVPEASVGDFLLSPPVKGACYVSCFTPEKDGMVAKVSIYHLSDPSKRVMELVLPAKIKDCSMLWNADGTALLASVSSDVDETGESYFGSTYLYWLKPEGNTKTQICGARDGQVQDVGWSPATNEFMVIVGMLPAAILLYNGETGKKTKDLGTSKRNTLRWNPFGRFIAIAGFGTLPGDLEFYDRKQDETLASFRAALTVHSSWSGDGRHFMSNTIAPRMNEGNQISVYTYTGEQILKLEYKPEVVQARHEDTGAGARTKTQALLFASSWRPENLSEKRFEDRAASPPRDGKKRPKGLPAAAEKLSAPTAAYRPKGAEGGAYSSVAAMMRGEIEVAKQERVSDGLGGWELKQAAPVMEEWEIKKMEKEAKKAYDDAEKAKVEADKQAIRDFQKGLKGNKQELSKLKEELAELQKLKDKDWDEMTEEDEEALEGEIDLRNKITELEKSGNT
mmetsp:Transcript_39929/g.72347  ORF Transcript_39929/g.72347 Transcript_39929/m.72347 type:complete len:647 (+) Transcript_39929:77-2017(+)|eukprot:CAMPEP_0115089782 /NCGR_PEP_ID=MMETSP0227-20121206/24945_1 /TAXON_ID=89957 /ORGANISM="Polarella glacialis, Strain CCMP 1383" /LENGTH=646 /DNA_ID=CAMNT_0002480615 /DNA_START=77 /DNA_END=2017 /DNA_ORIENTATION=+